MEYETIFAAAENANTKKIEEIEKKCEKREMENEARLAAAENANNELEKKSEKRAQIQMEKERNEKKERDGI